MLLWLSFCDPDKPKGKAFLGVAIVEADDNISAVRAAWDLGINPGGEVLICDCDQDIPQYYRNRLLSKEEAESLH